MLLLILFLCVARISVSVFFFSSPSCFVFMPNHCHYNMEHGDCGLHTNSLVPGCRHGDCSANRTTTTAATTTTRRRLRNWMTDALATVPPPLASRLLAHLPHTQQPLEPSVFFAGVLGSHFLEFCSAPFRTTESRAEKRNSHGVNMFRYIFIGTVTSITHC